MLDRLRELAVDRFGTSAAQLGPEDDLFETLGIDSLQAMDLLTDIESAFRVEIPDHEVQGLTTLQALADVLTDHLG